MADITDRPQPAPAFVPGTGLGSELPYRPLSGLAVAGFVLAAVYAFLVVGVFGVANFASLPLWLKVWAVVVPVVGLVVSAATWRSTRRVAAGVSAAYLLVLGVGLMYYAGSTTWLMPLWTALIPVVALAVCFAARKQVENSEGTLAGGDLARWGIGLSLVVGLTYWAYAAATFLAVRQQAAAFVQNQWLKALADGDLDTAFLLTLPPGNRPVSEVRSTLETTFNIAPDPSALGPFSKFGLQPFVRLLQAGGPGTTFSVADSHMPSYEKGGLQVTTVYHVRTRYAEFDLQVTANGTDAKGKGQPGRQWYIVADQTGIRGGDKIDPTEEGQVLLRESAAANRLAREWVRLVSSPARTPQNLETAYQLTLPPDRRNAPEPKADDQAARQYRAGLKEFQEGVAVRADKDTFWPSDDKQREELAAEARKAFDPGVKRDWMQFPNVQGGLLLPVITRDEGHLRLSFDVQMLIKDKIVGGRVVTVADVAEFTGKPPQWRVEGVDLIRARSMPSNPMRGRMPGM
jgi:hypothetical protein